MFLNFRKITSNSIVYDVGGLYMEKEQGPKSVVQFDPSHMVVANSSFTSNIAQVTGGALFTSTPDAIDVCGMPYVEDRLKHNPEVRAGVYRLPRLQNSSLAHVDRACLKTWTGNKAANGEGGDILASFATSVAVSTDELTCHIVEGCLISIMNHTSGGDLAPISVKLIDAFGKLALGHPHIQVHISEPPNAILSNHLFACKRAEAPMTGIRLLAKVNNTYDLTLSFEPQILGSVKLQVQVRECLPGETHDDLNEKCNSCGQDSYSFDPSKNCQRCPLFAKCSPSTIIPERYFWHSTSKSDHLQRCITQEACSFEGREHILWEQAWNAHSSNEYLDYRNNSRYHQCKKV